MNECMSIKRGKEIKMITHKMQNDRLGRWLTWQSICLASRKSQVPAPALHKTGHDGPKVSLGYRRPCLKEIIKKLGSGGACLYPSTQEAETDRSL